MKSIARRGTNRVHANVTEIVYAPRDHGPGEFASRAGVFVGEAQHV